ncbi:ABA4-like family protein [Lyngbya confervoides]|uniref:ABA4-like family protein n=1 Tax=Lyngbya confervoides BDU141951 TaxID=1574623 RepID=A0ABD4T313_9CYAN|nr:ABA4-like family protein [Lyngbya confervoides]MCM1982781.1 ABA4-like family protein [Lyngbya confervoides BDU141951]
MLPVDSIFSGANLFVLPFWTLMIFFPRWDWTKRIMGSFIPFALLSLVYLVLFVASLTPETAQMLANPTLKDVAAVFAKPPVAATGWVHFLVMDLFVGRWIYWEGQRTDTWTVHSLALCLFAGPMGLFSHILTAAIAARREANAASDPPGPPPTASEG